MADNDNLVIGFFALLAFLAFLAWLKSQQASAPATVSMAEVEEARRRL